MKRVDKNVERKNLDALVSSIRTNLMHSSGLDKIQPRTTLGKQALILAETLATYSATLTAVSSYTYMIQMLTPPEITQKSAANPSAGGVDKAVYDAYNTSFITSWNLFMTTADQWMQTAMPNSTTLYRELAKVPAQLITSNLTVVSDLQVMTRSRVGSERYNNAKDDLEAYLSVFIEANNELIGRVENYSESLENGTQQVIDAAETGALGQTLEAYESEIENLNAEILATREKLRDDAVDLALWGSVAVGGFCIGALGFAGTKSKNPVAKGIGYLALIAGGAVIAYSAVNILADLRAIAQDLNTINKDKDALSSDGQTAFALSALVSSIEGFTGSETAAIRALTSLTAAYQNLSDQLDTLATLVADDDPEDALDEWNAIFEAAQSLDDTLAYYWPGNTYIYHPNTIVPTSTGLYALDVSGAIYHYDQSTGSWNHADEFAVSIAASDTTIVRINGRPLSTRTSPQYTPTYYASIKKNEVWEDISNFPVGNIAVYDNRIYAVRSSLGYLPYGENYDDANSEQRLLSEVLLYTGQGTNWTSIGSPDPDDLPAYIAAVENGVVVTTLMTGSCYFWNGSFWTKLPNSTAPYLNPAAANENISLTDCNYNSSLTTASTLTPSVTSDSVFLTAVTGDSAPTQYVVKETGTLTAITTSGGILTSTDIRQDCLGIYGNITGTNFYLVDTANRIYHCEGADANMTFDLLPSLPTT